MTKMAYIPFRVWNDKRWKVFDGSKSTIDLLI